METTKSAAEKRISEDLSFRRRALVEAARYGSDPWVFVRELLQNARDAGARRVVFETVIGDGMERLTCRDDGVGMGYAHAQRYLFALYASSKEEEETQAGQFGIGFWSVLRFAPTSIAIRSRAAGEEAWKVALDGALEGVRIEQNSAFDLPHGTEIVLERPIELGTLSDKVFQAARRHGRFLTRREGSGSGRRKPRELEVVVDGQRINEPFGLPAPSASFAGRGFRGVVALGREPAVELFAHGLFVRSAKSLEELLDGSRRRTGDRTEDALAELPSLAPQVLLDSSELELLLARSDARQNRHLARLVRRAEKELSRLVERKLNDLRPQPWYRVWWGALGERLEFLEGRPLAAALLVGLVLGGALGVGSSRPWSWGELPDLGGGPGASQESEEEFSFGLPAGGEFQAVEGSLQHDPEAPGGGETWPSGWTSAPTNPGAPTSGIRGLKPPEPRPYRDLARGYRGPRVDLEDHHQGPQGVTALVYHPSTEPFLFNALVVDDLTFGRPASVRSTASTPYRATPCTANCLSVGLQVRAEDGLLRLPIPTGHRLTSSVVHLEGKELPVYETPQGEAVLRLTGPTVGALAYRTGPAPSPKVAAPPPVRSPAELQVAAAALWQRPRKEHITDAVEYVSRRVRYSRSPETVQAFAATSGEGFLEAALQVGAGDCDVQNGVLTALLWELGLEARMVLGYVGSRGLVAPGLHAWVEVRTDAGRWRAIDASLGAPVHPLEGAASTAGILHEDVLAATAATFPDAAVAGPWWGRPWNPLLLGLGGLLLVVLLLTIRRILESTPRGDDGTDLGAGGDLAALLGGALRHPAAFAAMPAVFHGRFVPLMGGGEALSLHQARRLAEERRLFRSEAGSQLAQRAAAGGVPVVDGRTPEGEVLSRAFGAIDLDHWGELLDRCYDTEASRRIDRGLARLGEPWRVKEAPELPDAAVEIALEDLRLGRRLVLIDPEHPDLAAVRSMAESARGDFALLDLLAPRLEQGPGDQARVLAHFAAAAVEEAAGAGAMR